MQRITAKVDALEQQVSRPTTATAATPPVTASAAPSPVAPPAPVTVSPAAAAPAPAPTAPATAYPVPPASAPAALAPPTPTTGEPSAREMVAELLSGVQALMLAAEASESAAVGLDKIGELPRPMTAPYRR